ncbi:MAG: deoxyuridine 5'-triphosphate nucleotidohydrolase [Lachnospiraceae bacterium]|nr:deoxyuridine 5'-triphosphate nucleotidohydrolase [Lachnospiraceae bacterium]
MERIAEFEKVSRDQFVKDWLDTFPESDKESANRVYDSIKLPKRATKGSAGYDFYAPLEISLKPGEMLKIPTGIRARMEEGWVLLCFPRSGLGFKFRMQLNNTVGVIDSDYYGSDNEGHIFARITNDSKDGKVLSVSAGSGFMQGIFLPFGITEDDCSDEVRNGGFGSTGR